MAVGGGDAFSLAASLLSIILIWSVLQWSSLIWFPELIKRYEEREVFLRRLDKSLTLVPAVLVILVILDLSLAHIRHDLTYAHVAAYGSSGSPTALSFLDTILVSGSPWLAVPLGFSLCKIWRWWREENPHSMLDEGRACEIRRQELLWNGFFWPIMLIGMIPSDSLAVHQESLASSAVLQEVDLFRLLLLVAGGLLEASTFSLQNGGEEFKERGFLASSAVQIVLGIILMGYSVFELGGEGWRDLAELASLGRLGLVPLCVALLPLLFCWTLHNQWMELVHDVRGTAKRRRFLGLGSSLRTTLRMTWLVGVVVLEPMPHVAGWFSAAWLSFTYLLPIAAVGLLGCLLPMAGLDASPRPEVWGFFLCGSLAFPLLVIRDPMMVAMVPGYLMSICVVPMLATHLEYRPDLEVRQRVFESVITMIVFFVGIYTLYRFLHGYNMEIVVFLFCCVTLIFLTPLMVRRPRNTSLVEAKIVEQA